MLKVQRRKRSGCSPNGHRGRIQNSITVPGRWIRALGFLPDATLATLSIPGEFAAREAGKCLDKDLNVFLFSDNVEIEAEISLKNKAREKNLLCMGPDCGTAYINGVGLGFANVVKPGRIGCIAASGTGLAGRRL